MQVLIPGFYDDVRPLTVEEKQLYDDIEFDVLSFQRDGNIQSLHAIDAKEFLMKRWRYPTLSIHGFDPTGTGY